MKTINELQDEVIEEFSDFDDWMDKYQLLIQPNYNRKRFRPYQHERRIPRQAKN